MLRAAILWIAMAFALAKPARAEDLPLELEVAIHLKILSFDSGLKARVTGDTLVIAILHGPDRRSEAVEIVSAISQLADKRKVSVHGKKLRAVALPITADLVDRLSGVGALYVTSNLPTDQVAAIARIAFARKLPTLCNNKTYLFSGLAVAVVSKADKPAIVVHAGNATQSGMVLDSKLLRLAEVVK